MALRVVLNKARPFGHQLKGGKLGFLGAISSGCNPSIAGHNSSCLNYSNTSPNSFWRRHIYCLPPPPAERVVDFRTVAGVRHVDDAETDDRAIKLAQFAVKAHNQGASQDEIDGRGEIRFVRVVRASVRRVVGLMYYITLEGLRGKADMNVYYAEVLDCPDRNLMKLIKWELVNDSFSYPFEEIRLSDFLEKKYRREEAAAKNYLVSTWLGEMELRCRNAEATKDSVFDQYFGNPDVQKQIRNFKNSVLNTDICPKNAMDPLPAVETDVETDVIVPVYDITAYETVCKYALFAVHTHNENEDDVIHFEEVLWASKSKVDGSVYWILLLEAMDRKKELNFYYAVIKVCQSDVELIKFHQIDESLCNPLKTDGVKLVVEGPKEMVGA